MYRVKVSPDRGVESGTTGILRFFGMVAIRVYTHWKHPDTGTANYLKLSKPGVYWQNPAHYI